MSKHLFIVYPHPHLKGWDHHSPKFFTCNTDISTKFRTLTAVRRGILRVGVTISKVRCRWYALHWGPSLFIRFPFCFFCTR